MTVRDPRPVFSGPDAVTRSDRWPRRALLVASILPGLYAFRALPTGWWHMVWAWASLLIGPPWVLVHWARWKRHRRPVLLLFPYAVAAVTFTMWWLARADARGELGASGRWVFAGLLAVQAVVSATVLVRVRRTEPDRAAAAAPALFAPLATGLLNVSVGNRLPLVVMAVAVGVLALTLDRGAALWERGRPDASDRGQRRSAYRLGWSVAALGVGSGVLGRPGGIWAALLVYVIGLALSLGRGAIGREGARVVPAALSTAALVVAIALVTPGPASFDRLLRWHLPPPADFELAAERYDTTLIRRYETMATPDAAVAELHANASSLTSTWAVEDAEFQAIVWGYRIVVSTAAPLLDGHRVLDAGRCYEGTTCVWIELRRSDERDDHVEPLELNR